MKKGDKVLKKDGNLKGVVESVRWRGVAGCTVCYIDYITVSWENGRVEDVSPGSVVAIP